MSWELAGVLLGQKELKLFQFSQQAALFKEAACGS